MATVRLKLRSNTNAKGLHSITIAIYQNSTHTTIPTRYAVQKKHFVNERITRACPDVSNVKEANLKLSRKLNEAWEYIEELEDKRMIQRMSAKDIANYIKNGGRDTRSDDFLLYLDKYIENIQKKSTREKYQNTASCLKRYYDSVFFPEITKEWLYNFKNKRLKEVTPATTNIDLRNIRAVFNHAIDVTETISQNIYPFRKFEFAKAQPRNLRLPLETIKKIRDFETENQFTERARDLFMLSFYLIGINIADLYNTNEIKEGKLEYWRKKTGKFYTIKVEKEAFEIIDKYKGKECLFSFTETFSTPQNLTKTLNKHLKFIGSGIGVDKLIMYHARHSWAGLAAKHPIGAGKDLIAQALGHGKTTVTDTYFDYDTKLVDDLNRKVLNLLK